MRSPGSFMVTQVPLGTSSRHCPDNPPWRCRRRWCPARPRSHSGLQRHAEALLLGSILRRRRLGEEQGGGGRAPARDAAVKSVLSDMSCLGFVLACGLGKPWKGMLPHPDPPQGARRHPSGGDGKRARRRSSWLKCSPLSGSGGGTAGACGLHVGIVRRPRLPLRRSRSCDRTGGRGRPGFQAKAGCAPMRDAGRAGVTRAFQ